VHYTDLPLVSVVIPTYNRCDFLNNAILSVLEQTYQNIEIIVVDDGSTDNTAMMLKKFEKKIIYIKKKNGGLGSARNTGMKYSKGKYVALMDSDDSCDPNRISFQVTYLECENKSILCSSDFSAYDGVKLVEQSHIKTYYSILKKHVNGFNDIYGKVDKLICKMLKLINLIVKF
jgi:glycosyltransferase involved in cell wall biosynthesis